MQEIFVPAMGMAPDNVTLTSWLKAPGDPLHAGEVVAVVETSKAELEIEAAADGSLGRQLFPAGAQIAPGTTISHVLAAGEVEPDAAPIATREPVTVAAAPEAPATSRSDADPPPRHTTSPRQRRLAAEAAAAPLQATAPTPTTAPAPDRFRDAISASVVRSWQEIPHFAVTREVRVDALVDAVKQWKSVLPGLTLTDVLLRALALSLLDRERASRLDLGLAVATDRGVAIPVLRDVLSLGLVELVDARRAAAERARAGRLSADDAATPVSTLSNLGALGVDQFTGVVPFGQTSLLTVGRAAPRPVAIDGQLAVATTMSATLNVDHRSWDGYHAGELLQRFAAALAAPATLLAPTVPDPTEERS